MTYLRIIPSLLLKNKKLIKGVKFKNHIIAGNPKTTIQTFDSQKSDEIFLIDFDAYKNSRPDFEELKKITATINTPLTFGGGLNSIENIKLAFLNGADKVYISSAIQNNDKIIQDVSLIYGNQSIVGGINLMTDSNNFFMLNYDIDPISFAKKLVDLGVGEIKITFVNLEGSRRGFNLSICEKFLKNIKIPIIFEGGIGSLEDIEKAANAGVQNIALGTLLIFSDYNIFKIKQHLSNKGYKIRN
tara:strand:+ start:5070 stop:5801 length:732 start_codon:yes stop_codon:yes gene_type:complete